MTIEEHKKFMHDFKVRTAESDELYAEQALHFFCGNTMNLFRRIGATESEYGEFERLYNELATCFINIATKHIDEIKAND